MKVRERETRKVGQPVQVSAVAEDADGSLDDGAADDCL